MIKSCFIAQKVGEKDKKANFGVIFWRVGRLQTGFLVIITQDKASDKERDNILHTFLHVFVPGPKRKVQV